MPARAEGSKVAQLRAMRERNYRERNGLKPEQVNTATTGDDDEPTPRPIKRTRKKGK